MGEKITPQGKSILCPVCKNNTALEEEYKKTKSWLCLKCGYNSNSLFKRKSKELRDALKESPEIIKDLKFWDVERKIFWIPSVIQMESRGMIYPDGTVDKWNWIFSPVIKIPEKEQKNYKIPGSDKCFTKRLAVEQSKKFEWNEYSKALKEIGALLYLEEN